MSRTMSTDHKQLLAEASQRATEERAAMRSKKLIIGAWMVYKFDADNYCIEPSKGDIGNRRYYPNLPVALSALFKILVGEGSKDAANVEQVLRTITEAEKRISAAVLALDI